MNVSNFAVIAVFALSLLPAFGIAVFGAGCSGDVKTSPTDMLSSTDASSPADASLTTDTFTPSEVRLFWSGYSDHRRCSIDIEINGSWIGCTLSATVGYTTEFLFDGSCTRNDQTYSTSSISKFKLNCALDGDLRVCP